MFGGEFNATLDDTGRISLPRRLRDALEKSKVVVTKGINLCLWVYTVEQWKALEETIVASTNQFSARDLAFRRRIIGPNQEVDIDRQGRILIPPTLRDYAGLSKDCIVLGQHNCIEIWAEDRYKAYQNESEDDFRAGSEEFGRIIKERELGAYGNSPHSGTAGGDIGISRPEGQA